MSKIKYHKIWEEYHGKKLLAGYEIHHIDGNRKNNQPENLLAVTIEEHLEIHLNQKDHGAVQAILARMDLDEAKRELLKKSASEHQKQLLIKGTHNFQQISKEQRMEISREAGLKTKELNIGIHRINSDPILAKENAKKGRAGLSREKELEMMKNWHAKIKNSYWWNNGKINKRSQKCPGDGFVKGMISKKKEI